MDSCNIIMHALLMYKPDLPDSLSLLRLISALPCAWFIVTQNWVVAGIIFMLAVLTDIADGFLARKMDKVTTLGGILDHTSDAVFVASCLAALAWLEMIPWLLPPLILLAFIQYLLDSSALSGKGLIASSIGRYNGILYFLLAGLAVLQQTFNFFLAPQLLITIASWILIITTLLSMADRLIRIRSQ